MVRIHLWSKYLNINMLKIYNKNSVKYLKHIFWRNPLSFNLLVQDFYNNKIFNKSNSKLYCLYTNRNRSVFRSFRMCRHKLKEFLDNRTFFNIYVK